MSKEKENKKIKSVKTSTFDVASFREHSQELFGVKPEVIDGVFFNAKNGEKFTKEEAKRKVEAFLRRKV